jgi:hypothetical protein
VARSLEPSDKLGVLGGIHALLEDSENRRQVVPQQCRRVEPEPRKHCAPKNAVSPGWHHLESPFVVHEPVNLLVVHAPNNVFSKSAAALNVQLNV